MSVVSLFFFSVTIPRALADFKKLRNCMDVGLSESVVINPNLIAQLVSGDDSDNGLEICKLDYDPVHLTTVCFLTLPQFPRHMDAIPEVSFTNEWVPTLEHAAWERLAHLPFQSSSLGTVNMLLAYIAPTNTEAFEAVSPTYVMTLTFPST